MWLLLIIVEITIAGVLAVKLGMEADDKGFSKALFIFLSGLLWFIMRMLGRVLGWIIIGGTIGPMAIGWLLVLGSFMVFYYFVSRVKDKEFFNQDDIEWKKRNTDTHPAENRKTDEN